MRPCGATTGRLLRDALTSFRGSYETASFYVLPLIPLLGSSLPARCKGGTTRSSSPSEPASHPAAALFVHALMRRDYQHVAHARAEATTFGDQLLACRAESEWGQRAVQPPADAASRRSACESSAGSPTGPG
jgi:hypothetical protein